MALTVLPQVPLPLQTKPARGNQVAQTLQQQAQTQRQLPRMRSQQMLQARRRMQTVRAALLQLTGTGLMLRAVWERRR